MTLIDKCTTEQLSHVTDTLRRGAMQCWLQAGRRQSHQWSDDDITNTDIAALSLIHSLSVCVSVWLCVCLCVCVSVCLRAILVLIVTLFVCLLLSLSKSHIDVRLFCSQLVLLPAYCCSLPVSVSVYLPLSASVCVWVFKQLVATSTVRLDLTTVDCKSSQPPQCRVDMILTAVIGLESDDDGG